MQVSVQLAEAVRVWRGEGVVLLEKGREEGGPPEVASRRHGSRVHAREDTDAREDEGDGRRNDGDDHEAGAVRKEGDVDRIWSGGARAGGGGDGGHRIWSGGAPAWGEGAGCCCRI